MPCPEVPVARSPAVYGRASIASKTMRIVEQAGIYWQLANSMSVLCSTVPGILEATMTRWRPCWVHLTIVRGTSVRGTSVITERKQGLGRPDM